jgi:hypothetical protein
VFEDRQLFLSFFFANGRATSNEAVMHSLLVIHSRFYAVRSQSYLTGSYHTPFGYSQVRHCGPDLVILAKSPRRTRTVWHGVPMPGGLHSPLEEQLWPVIGDCKVGGAGRGEGVGSWGVGGLDGRGGGLD